MAVGLRQCLYRFLIYGVSISQTTLRDRHDVFTEVESALQLRGKTVAENPADSLHSVAAMRTTRISSLHPMHVQGLLDIFVREQFAPLLDAAGSLGEMIHRAQRAERTRRVVERNCDPDRTLQPELTSRLTPAEKETQRPRISRRAEESTS